MHDPIQLLESDLQGMTQQDLARKIGISPQQLCDVLRKHRAPRGRILDYYGLEMHISYETKDGKGAKGNGRARK